MNWIQVCSWVSLVFFLHPAAIGFCQIDIEPYIEDYREGTTNEQINAVRGISSFAIRQLCTPQEREKIVAFLKAETKAENPTVRLTVFTELLKIAAAEDDLELGRMALEAVNDKNLRVRRGILKYFRTFFSKRYKFGKSYEDLMLKMLVDEDLDIRFQAAATLHSWGICNAEILDILIDSIQLTNYRAGITYSLVSDTKQRSQTVAKLANRLKKSDLLSASYITLLSLLTPESTSVMNEILDQHDSPHAAVRAAVITAIGRMQTEPDRSLQILNSAADDEVPTVRQLVIPTLIRLAPEAKYVKDVMFKLMKDPERGVAETASATLGYFKDDFSDVEPELRQILAGKDTATIATTLNGLAVCGPMASILANDVANLLQHEDFDVRVRACWALNEITDSPDNAARALNQLIENETNSGVLVAAVQVLSYLKPNDETSKKQFLKYLDSSNPYLQFASLEGLIAYRDVALCDKLLVQRNAKPSRSSNTLSQFDTAIVEAISGMGNDAVLTAKNYLNSENPIVRSRALRIVGAAGGDSDRQAINAGLKSKHPLVSYSAAIAASKLKSVDLDMLQAMFDLTNANERQRTVNILNLFGEMGERAGPITPKIASLLNGLYRNRFANDAKRVLVQLGKFAAPAIQELLKPELNLFTLDCLAAIGVPNEAAAKQLEQHIEKTKTKYANNRNLTTRPAEIRSLLFAAVALSRMSADSSKAIQMISAELNTENKSLALSCIKKLGNPGPELLGKVIKMLPDPEAIQTLADIGKPANSAFDSLMKLTQSKDRNTAILAKQALYKIQDEPGFAIEVVEQLIEDNRYELIDIKIEDRQILWETIRFLHDNHNQDQQVVTVLDTLERGRFPNLRTFVFDLRN